MSRQARGGWCRICTWSSSRRCRSATRSTTRLICVALGSITVSLSLRSYGVLIMSDLSGPVGDTQPAGPTEHLDTVDYWKGLYLTAVEVGQENLNQLRAELSDVRNERVALRTQLDAAQLPPAGPVGDLPDAAVEAAHQAAYSSMIH